MQTGSMNLAVAADEGNVELCEGAHVPLVVRCWYETSLGASAASLGSEPDVDVKSFTGWTKIDDQHHTML